MHLLLPPYGAYASNIPLMHIIGLGYAFKYLELLVRHTVSKLKTIIINCWYSTAGNRGIVA